MGTGWSTPNREFYCTLLYIYIYIYIYILTSSNLYIPDSVSLALLARQIYILIYMCLNSSACDFTLNCNMYSEVDDILPANDYYENK